MKLKLEEVIESVRDELLCYEGAEEAAARWEAEFRDWAAARQGKDKALRVGKNGVCLLHIRDEEEIFEMADAYMDALAEGKVAEYWKGF